MEEKKGIDPNLMSIFGKPIDSKATAMQYALDSTATYENGNKVLHTDKAKEIFDFICANVDLPNVPKGLMDGLDETLKRNAEFLQERLYQQGGCIDDRPQGFSKQPL